MKIEMTWLMDDPIEFSWFMEPLFWTCDCYGRLRLKREKVWQQTTTKTQNLETTTCHLKIEFWG